VVPVGFYEFLHGKSVVLPDSDSTPEAKPEAKILHYPLPLLCFLAIFNPLCPLWFGIHQSPRQPISQAVKKSLCKKKNLKMIASIVYYLMDQDLPDHYADFERM
jgi:hypothetical protein